MKKILFYRLLELLPVLLGITFLTFGLMYLAGGDAVTQLYDNRGPVAAEIINLKRAQLGLDRPFWSQYLDWLLRLLQGDLGNSYVTGQPVALMLGSRLPATLFLAVGSVCLTLLLSLPLGIAAAVYNHRPLDFAIRILSLIGNGLPNFLIALILLQLLAVELKLLPALATGYSLKSAVLPMLTLTLAMSPKYIRQVRALVLEELYKDYVWGARARGIKETAILWRSVLKTCLVPLLTLVVLSLGSLLGGAAIVETIFMWDGVGRLAVDAIMVRDYPVVQAYVLWMALIYVFLNFITDLLYPCLDPRLRLEAKNDK